jgi:flagellar protein FliJ
MAQSRFPLQAVLDQRTALRDLRRCELADALRARETLENGRAALAAHQRELRRAQEAAQSDRQLDVQRLFELQRYVQVLRHQERELSRQEVFWTDQIERRQTKLVEADREVRVVQLLAERRQHQHRQRAERLEAELLDEARSSAELSELRAFN